LLNLIRNEMF